MCQRYLIFQKITLQKNSKSHSSCNYIHYFRFGWKKDRDGSLFLHPSCVTGLNSAIVINRLPNFIGPMNVYFELWQPNVGVLVKWLFCRQRFRNSSLFSSYDSAILPQERKEQGGLRVRGLYRPYWKCRASLLLPFCEEHLRPWYTSAESMLEILSSCIRRKKRKLMWVRV